MKFEDYLFDRFEAEMEDRKFSGPAEKRRVFEVWMDQLSTSDWIEFGEEMISSLYEKR